MKALELCLTQRTITKVNHATQHALSESCKYRHSSNKLSPLIPLRMDTAHPLTHPRHALLPIPTVRRQRQRLRLLPYFWFRLLHRESSNNNIDCYRCSTASSHDTEASRRNCFESNGTCFASRSISGSSGCMAVQIGFASQSVVLGNDIF